MTAPIITAEQIMWQVNQLPMRERLRLVEQILEHVAIQLPTDAEQPKHSLEGLWKGVSISEEDIAEARREMWGQFAEGDDW